MTNLEALVQAALRWPLFEDHQLDVMVKLQQLVPPASAIIDLPIAYAMAVWPHLRCDWRKACGVSAR